MNNHLAKLFSTSVRKIVGDHLPKIVGQPVSRLSDLDFFQQSVVDPAWEDLPLPCKMLRRERLKWDEVFDQFREAALDVSGEKIALRKDVSSRTNAVFKRAVAGVDLLIKESLAVADSRSLSPTETESASQEPDTETLAVGIDLGTTYSAVAVIDPDGRPMSIQNSAGDLLTPSVVLFEPEGTVVGKEAANAASMEPDRVAICVKRDMGQKIYAKSINGEMLPPEVISSLILRSLKADVERKMGPVTKAVITVPAYFDEPRRQATIDAGRLAGLEVLDIINEPTAAAVAYGYQLGFLDRSGTKDGQILRALVFDLGGGTFDVTILQIQGNSFEAIATDGDVRLGGKDWDDALIGIVAQQFIEKHGEDPRESDETMLDLAISVETAKKTLSERPRANILVNHQGTRMKAEVTRDEFEAATAPLINRTRQTTESVLRQAGLSWNDIDRVLVVGGSTRIPSVVAALEEVSGHTVDRALSPDEAVAHGAALYADLLLHRERNGDNSDAAFQLTNVNSHSLGIVGLDNRTKRKVNHTLIPKNTSLPHTVAKVFKTAETNQQNIKIEVLEGENTRPEHCTSVGKCVVRNLPTDLPKGSPVEVEYSYQENGRLHVTARLKGQPEKVTATFSRDNNMQESDLVAWQEFVTHESQSMSD